MRSLMIGLLAAAAMSSGCALDKFFVKGAITETLLTPDPNYACTSAAANMGLISSLTKSTRALTILEMTGSTCIEEQMWEVELEIERAKRHIKGPADVEAIEDLRARAMRMRTAVARRQWRAWNYMVQQFGEPGGECPKLKSWPDQYAYFLGLIAGSNALLYDQSGGGHVGVPTNTIGIVGTAAMCLPNEDWFFMPEGLQAAAWATVPGTAPEGVDPWQALDEAAVRGDATGVRMVRGLQAAVAGNAGRDEWLSRAVKGMADAQAAAPAADEFALFDAYATSIVQHQADMVWAAATGHRAPGLVMPSTEAPSAPEIDIGDDPFAEPAAPASDDSDVQETP